MSNVQQYPLFFRVNVVGVGAGCGQDYIVLAWDRVAAYDWGHREHGASVCVSVSEIGATIRWADMTGNPSPKMINACYIEPRTDHALAFYEALIEGTETLGGIGEQHGAGALVHLIYLLGAMMRDDAGAPGGGEFVQLWDHYEDLAVLDCLNEVIAESPELAPAIQRGIDKIDVMPLEG